MVVPALEVAEKMGIKMAIFWPAGPATLAIILSIPKLIQDGIIDTRASCLRRLELVGPFSLPLHPLIPLTVRDELDPTIRANFERRGWLPLLDISDPPPPSALIREFYSNISIHVYDSNTLVKSWIRGVGYTITPQVVADALGVPLVRDPVYPYDESLELSDVLYYITGTSVQWGSDPKITSAELSGLHYLFFRIACHSIWPISHVHTIPLERCVFLYALVTDASISFPHLFLRSLNNVYRSSSSSHALVHPIFIHRILLHLDLSDFPSSEPVHVIAPIGASFLRQRAAHLRAGSKHPRSEPSSSAPPPSSSSTGTAGENVPDPIGDDAAAADVPPPPSTDFNVRRTLETVVTVQAAYSQILVDLLDEIRALRADLARLHSPSPPPFDGDS
nr:hypothetical protein CFP56_61181 [Quercus suber]